MKRTNPHSEGWLTRKLIEAVRLTMPGAEVIKHADRITSGVPDLSVTWNGRTSWYEIKHADPNFSSMKLQELTCLRLAAVGICHYIVFSTQHDLQRTLIVQPRDLAHYTKSLVFCGGYKPHWAAEKIKEFHL
jgi:hypothetical protein